VPIFGRKPSDCFNRFESHVRPLVAATVTARYPLQGLRLRGGRRMTLSFRESEPIAVPIKTKFGRLYFSLGQALEAVEEDNRFRLRTRQYWYRLQEAPGYREPAIFRWEYETETAWDAHCRHHLQGALDIPLGSGTLALDNAHLPTGWVTMEEVIRFLIVDLEHEPPCGDEWPDVLQASEEAFYEKFTGKRYKART
jgi:hypothetical protein